MKKFIFLSIMIFVPLNAFAVCNVDTTFDATVSVDIPKPKGFFSGTPKPSPEIGRAHVRTPVTSQSRMPSSA